MVSVNEFARMFRLSNVLDFCLKAGKKIWFFVGIGRVFFWIKFCWCTAFSTRRPNTERKSAIFGDVVVWFGIYFPYFIARKMRSITFSLKTFNFRCHFWNETQYLCIWLKRDVSASCTIINYWSIWRNWHLSKSYCMMCGIMRFSKCVELEFFSSLFFSYKSF